MLSTCKPIQGWAALALLLASATVAQTQAESRVSSEAVIPVTPDNFVRAKSDLYFGWGCPERRLWQVLPYP